MSPFLNAALIFAFLFGSALLGLRLRGRLPRHHLSTETKEAVNIGMGSVATMAALLLGLLVASAKEAYDAERHEVHELAAKLVHLDRVLANYGPEATEARAVLRSAVQSATHRIWPDAPIEHGTIEPSVLLSAELPKAIQQLSPTDEAQRTFKRQAAKLANSLGQMRWLLFEQGESSISPPLLTIVVFWLALTFISVGLFAPTNATVITAQFMAALSVAGAVFLILELDQPFAGLLRISSEPMLSALSQLAK